MKWYLASAVSALALFVPVAAVQASGDYGCSPVWKLSNGPGRGVDERGRP